MEFEKIEKIKKWVVIAICSDDELLERFVLKGGSALDLVYRYPLGRMSVDLDFSMKGDFKTEELPKIIKRLEQTLRKTFQKHNYTLFDFQFNSRPAVRRVGLPEFWGGYEILFKIIDTEKFLKYRHDLRFLQRTAEVLGVKQKRPFKIDISNHEYCDIKIEREIEHYACFVYPPPLIVAEKLRAICQQMPTYRFTGNRPRARARDFYDIYVVVKNEKTFNWKGEEFLRIVRHCFAAKEVPLELLKKIPEESTFAFHQPDFQAVEATVLPPAGQKLKDFSFYFRFVSRLSAVLKPLWEK